MSDRKKQADSLAEYLAANRIVTPLAAWTQLGIYRLAARVYDLRQRGLPIRTTEQNGVTTYVLEAQQ
jgi:hypothetical protein